MDRLSAVSMLTRAFVLVALVVAVSVWLQSSAAGGALVASLQVVFAQTASGFLAATGLEHTLDGVVLRMSSAAVEVSDDCVGLDVGLFVGCAMLVHPAPLRRKLSGVASALGVVMALNWARVVTLAWLAQGSHAAFEVSHVYVWPGLLIAVCVGVFGLWLRGLRPEPLES